MSSESIGEFVESLAHLVGHSAYGMRFPDIAQRDEKPYRVDLGTLKSLKVERSNFVFTFESGQILLINFLGLIVEVTQAELNAGRHGTSKMFASLHIEGHPGLYAR